MSDTPTVRCDFVFWDWKEQPDFSAIEASANLLLAQGATRIHLTPAQTEGDSYCIVISDEELAPDEATRAYEDWEDTISPDDPAPVDQPPFVWHRR